jgi:hypothetical protein
MSEREHELAARRAALQDQCAMQRVHLAETAEIIESQLGGIDRGINAIRSLGRNPLLIAGGISLLVLIGPKRIMGWAGRGFMLVSTAKRLLPAARGLLQMVRSRREGLGD